MEETEPSCLLFGWETSENWIIHLHMGLICRCLLFLLPSLLLYALSLSPCTHRHLALPPWFNHRHRPCLLHPSLHRATHDSACHAPPCHSQPHRPGVLPRPCVLVWQPRCLPRTLPRHRGYLPEAPPRSRGCLPEAPLRHRGDLPEALPRPTWECHHLAHTAACPRWVVPIRSFFYGRLRPKSCGNS